MKRLLLAIVAIACVFAIKTNRAEACSCRPLVLADQLENSDLVFVGSAQAREDAPKEGKAFRPGPTKFTFAVERTFKGAAGDTVVISTASNSAACGSNFEIGTSYVVYANSNKGEMKTSLCSGNATSTPELLAKIEEALGTGSEPPPEPTPPPPEPVDPPALPPNQNTGNPACGGCASSGGTGLLGALVLIGMLAASRRRR